jgi:acyl-CoA thioester hydrolase
MNHEYTIKIYHKDTDCYGIVWHGAYIKWFEIGRIEFSVLAGVALNILDDMEILMPVVELNCRYKSPARLYDELSISTELKSLKRTSAVFSHTIKNINTGVLILSSETTIVTTDKNGKLYRNMPEYLYNKFDSILHKTQELNLI